MSCQPYSLFFSSRHSDFFFFSLGAIKTEASAAKKEVTWMEWKGKKNKKEPKISCCLWCFICLSSFFIPFHSHVAVLIRRRGIFSSHRLLSVREASGSRKLKCRYWLREKRRGREKGKNASHVYLSYLASGAAEVTGETAENVAAAYSSCVTCRKVRVKGRDCTWRLDRENINKMEMMYVDAWGKQFEDVIINSI